MKCPNCGHWNRDTFPRCFRCGTPLSRTPGQGEETAAPARETGDESQSKIYIQINDEGQATSAVDEKDQLAREMENLLARKQRGEKEHRRLQANSVREGIAPTGRAVQTLTGRRTYAVPQSILYDSDGEDQPVEGAVRPDAIPVKSQRVIGEEYPDYDPVQAVTGSAGGRRRRRQKVKMYRHTGVHRALRVMLIVLMLGAIAAALAMFVWPRVFQGQRFSLEERTEVSVSIVDEMPAHAFRIHLPEYEGRLVWITEMRKHYQVTDEYVTFERADYKCYETSDNVTEESVTATITASVQISPGEHRELGQIQYEVEIPLSPLTLVDPDVNWSESPLYLYPIKFIVAKNSTVTINGQDQSDLVNTQDGLITFQASLSPKGDNEFVITTRAQHYRENTQVVTIYRAPQEIPLDLDVDIPAGERYSPGLVDDTSQPKDSKGNYPKVEDKLVVRGTTSTMANLTVKSNYEDLDTTKLRIDGTFSFKAVFDKIGTNSIIIEASREGMKTSVVQLDIYYVPIAAIYTRKAWDMNTQYSDYLNHSDTRIANTQIYVCKGTITEIISERPQVAKMKLFSDYERYVVIRNYSNDTWEMGKDYRVYADAYDIFDGAPWLNGRYTYPVN